MPFPPFRSRSWAMEPLIARYGAWPLRKFQIDWGFPRTTKIVGPRKTPWSFEFTDRSEFRSRYLSPLNHPWIHAVPFPRGRAGGKSGVFRKLVFFSGNEKIESSRNIISWGLKKRDAVVLRRMVEMLGVGEEKRMRGKRERRVTDKNRKTPGNTVLVKEGAKRKRNSTRFWESLEIQGWGKWRSCE